MVEPPMRSICVQSTPKHHVEHCEVVAGFDRGRFFGGLTVEETAEALKVSVDTVMRDWKIAKAWLLRELKTG